MSASGNASRSWVGGLTRLSLASLSSTSLPGVSGSSSVVSCAPLFARRLPRTAERRRTLWRSDGHSLSYHSPCCDAPDRGRVATSRHPKGGRRMVTPAALARDPLPRAPGVARRAKDLDSLHGISSSIDAGAIITRAAATRRSAAPSRANSLSRPTSPKRASRPPPPTRTSSPPAPPHEIDPAARNPSIVCRRHRRLSPADPGLF